MDNNAENNSLTPPPPPLPPTPPAPPAPPAPPTPPAPESMPVPPAPEVTPISPADTPTETAVIPDTPAAAADSAAPIIPPALASPVSPINPPASSAPAAPSIPNIPNLPNNGEKKKGKGKKWIVFAVIALVILLAGGISYKVVAGRFSAENTAEKYLSALVDGKASKALAAYDPNYSSRERILLTDEIYSKAKDRPSDFQILNVIAQENSAAENSPKDSKITRSVGIEAELTIDMKKYPVFLTVEERGKKFGLFNNWVITEAPLGTMNINNATAQLSINGVEVDLSALSEGEDDGGSYYLPAFPGTYTIAAQSNEDLITSDSDTEVVVPVDGSSKYVQIDMQFTDEVLKQAQEQVKSHYDKCMESTTFEVADCPDLEMQDPVYKAISEIKRSWKKDPKISLESKSPIFQSGAYQGYVSIDGQALINYKERMTDSDPWKDASSPLKISISNSFRFSIKDGKVKVDFQEDKDNSSDSD